MSGYPYGSGSYAGVPPGSSPYASPYAQAVGGPGPGPSGSTSQRTSHRQSTGVHHAPNQLPSYQQAQLSSKLSIHDPKAFSASSVQVEMYLKERLSLCVGANSDSQLPRFVTTCLQQRSTRIVHVNTQQLVSIDVGGQFGLRFRIADLYTALGFIVSETDPYPYTLQETLKQLCEIHLRILAVYEKWITTLSQRFNGNQEVPPNTACLMWRTRTRPDGSWTYVMGLFPNLATNEMIFRCKEQARQIVQDSLQAAFANINVEPPSPRELNEPHSGLIGECAEILALLYLLESDPALINGLEIYGLSANLFVDAVRNMLSYNRDKFRSFLKGACRNCRHVIDRIDDNGPLPADPQTAALRYFDMATRSAQENWDQRPPPIPDPQQKPCQHCQQRVAGGLRYECSCCKEFRYCTPLCQTRGWDRHARECPAYQRCANKCGIAFYWRRHPQRKTWEWLTEKYKEPTTCRVCDSEPERLPTLYCGTICKDQDHSKHRTYCQNLDNYGPVPALKGYRPPELGPTRRY